MQIKRIAIVAAAVVALSATAAAQRLPFDRTIETTGPAALDVSTLRGKIDVRGGAPGKVVVKGTVTVRTDWDVPSNAVEIMREVAANPPIEVAGNSVRLRPPSDERARRAVTVAYEVEVPPATRVLTVSDSGATMVSAVTGSVETTTQSGAIAVAKLGSTARIRTGSGAVRIDGVDDALSVTTGSSAITARGLRGDVMLRTNSGAVDAALTGGGDVDVETASSAIRLCGAAGGLNAASSSGHLTIHGKPARPWAATTGSGGMEIGLDPSATVALDVSSRSGKVRLDAGPVQGTVQERRVDGTLGGGGPLVRAESRSGSIDVISARSCR